MSLVEYLLLVPSLAAIALLASGIAWLIGGASVAMDGTDRRD
jgi:hypothetical protein